MSVDRERFFKIHGLKVGKCLSPSMDCDKAAIKAHSIQNGRVLSLMEEGGHVVAPRLRIGSSGPEIELKYIGRNQASTFTGMCAEHDAGIFAEIDNSDLDFGDAKQLFLYAYRAVTRELHATIEGGVKMQSGYQARVEAGLDPGDAPSLAGLVAVGHLMKAWETWKYRLEFFDRQLESEAWEELEHDTFMFEDQPPAIALSSMFSLPHLERGEDLVRVSLTVIPVAPNRTAVMFSYAPPDAIIARAWLSRILTARGQYQKYELSKLIVARVENFVLSKSHFDTWSSTKRQAVVRCFTATIGNEKMPQDDADLMLF